MIKLRHLGFSLKLLILTLGIAALGFGRSPGQKDAPPPQNKPEADAPVKDRGQLDGEIADARLAFEKNARDPQSRFQLASLLYQAGDFRGSGALLQPLLKAEKPATETLFLGASLEYLLARYGTAESLLRRIMTQNPSDEQAQVRAQTKLVFVYYQMKQYAKTTDLFQGLEGKVKLPLWDMMRSFGTDEPYQAVWPNDLRQGEVPFIVTDPLPLISVELQGRQIYALIDTGADMFVLDNEIAALLGIKPVASSMGTFAGGKQAAVGFTKADSLTIGGITLKSVPVSILPTKRFSSGFAGGKYTIGGIVGTGVLKQFLATLDYPHARLILRRPNENAFQEIRRYAKGKTVIEVPFVLAMTHFMMVPGRLNEKAPLTFFVDSGLASEAAFTAPLQTLTYAGIPVPETKVPEGSIGGGGGAGFATGRFSILHLGLGPLAQENKIGDYGTMPPASYWSLGFIDDGIISHQFLRAYEWSIDFSGMKMIFAK